MDLSLLATPWLGTPLYLWVAFLSLVTLLLAFDLGVLHRKSEEISIRQSLTLSGGYIAIGLLFGGFVWWHIGAESGLAYLTGFVIEKTLALDNIFVIALIFSISSSVTSPGSRRHFQLLPPSVPGVFIRASAPRQR